MNNVADAWLQIMSFLLNSGSWLSVSTVDLVMSDKPLDIPCPSLPGLNLYH